MNRENLLALLRQNKPHLKQHFGVKRLGLFGSASRNTATAASDIDVLVSFEGRATSDQFFGVQFFLEDLFGRPVDLVTEKALRAELRPYIEREVADV